MAHGINVLPQTIKTMKTNNLLIATAVSALTIFASCDKPEEMKGSALTGKGKLTAPMEQPADPAGTKTSLDGTLVKWLNGDEIQLNNSPLLYPALLQTAETGTSASFSFVSEGDFSITSPYYSIYPVDIYNTCQWGPDEGFSYRVNIPSTQTYAQNSFGLGAAPMMAHNNANETNIHFKNVFGVLKLQLKGDGRLVLLK